MSITSVLQKAIQSAFSKDRPFLFLREAGLVAHLRDALVMSDLGTTKAKLTGTSGCGSEFFWGNSATANSAKVETCRVQLELKIAKATCEAEDNVSEKDRTDLVIFRRSGVVLRCAPNGPGDVIACVNPAGVQAAIEVKACPAGAGDQFVLILRDIQRLYDLPGDIEVHMVVADKSQDLFGRWVVGNRQPVGYQRRPEWLPSGRSGRISDLVQKFAGTSVVNEVNALTVASLSIHKKRAPDGKRQVVLHVAGVKQALYVY